MSLDKNKIQVLLERIGQGEQETLSSLSLRLFKYLEEEASGNQKYIELKNNIPNHIPWSRSANGAFDGNNWQMPANAGSLAFALFWLISQNQWGPLYLYPISTISAAWPKFIRQFLPPLEDAIDEVMKSEVKIHSPQNTSTGLGNGEHIEAPLRVFISYSHDSQEHKQLVTNLAGRLTEDGIEVILDQWNVSLGSDLGHFMEQGLTKADRVLVICTPSYCERANEGHGGVGYEKTILTQELMSKSNTDKFVPVIFSGDKHPLVPTCLVGRLYIDMRSGVDAVYQSLIQDLYRQTPASKPPMGKSPYSSTTMATEAQSSDVTSYTEEVARKLMDIFKQFHVGADQILPDGSILAKTSPGPHGFNPPERRELPAAWKYLIDQGCVTRAEQGAKGYRLTKKGEDFIYKGG